MMNMSAEEMNPDILKTIQNIWLEKKLCDTIINSSSDALNGTSDDEGGLWCPPSFDGVKCWPKTRAGKMATRSCPEFMLGWDPRRFAFKKCLDNGTWFRHPEPPYKEWSNYTTCVDFEDLNFRQFINNIYIIGYSISLAAILISLVIFLSFRSLRCTRISIHIHLFVSFVLNNIMWLVWYREVVPVTEVIKTNPVWCQLLHLMIHYLMLANYMWMFCEGLHLHLALVVVFVRDEVAMKCFMVLGWAVPLLLVGVYAAVRASSPDDCQRCWMKDSNSTWILTAPVCVSLIASMVFLINVVRVLLTKLHPSSAHPAPVGMRKAVRATLILVPLFGLHFVLIPFRPDQNSPAEHAYQTFSAILVSLQGFCVACLFCFANQDVLQAVGTRVRRLFPSAWDRTTYTGAMDSAGIVANGNTQSRDVVV